MTAPNFVPPIGWQAKYIGRPYLWRARGPEVFDCWGFTAFIWKALFNIVLPDYLDVLPKDADAADRYRLSSRALQSGEKTMRQIDKPRPLAICLMRHGGSPSHVGLYAHGGLIVQACENAQQVIQGPTSDLSPRIIGFYWPSDYILKANS